MRYFITIINFNRLTTHLKHTQDKNGSNGPASLWQKICHNNFGNQNHLNIHIRGCKWASYQHIFFLFDFYRRVSLRPYSIFEFAFDKEKLVHWNHSYLKCALILSYHPLQPHSNSPFLFIFCLFFCLFFVYFFLYSTKTLLCTSLFGMVSPASWRTFARRAPVSPTKTRLGNSLILH